jgi:hypothetical protein
MKNVTLFIGIIVPFVWNLYYGNMLTRELLEKIEREDARDILKREIEKMKHG